MIKRNQNASGARPETVSEESRRQELERSSGSDPDRSHGPGAKRRNRQEHMKNYKNVKKHHALLCSAG
jgi:hypothetical protein